MNFLLVSLPSIIKSLSLEAIDKLNKIKQKSIGQASRTSGVSPADITVLIVHFGRSMKNFLLLIVLFSSCASIQTLDGGETDKTPPTVLSVSPENRSLLVNS